MLTLDDGKMLRRASGIGAPFKDYDTGFGTVFSISELGLRDDGAIYGIATPPGNNFVTATRMSVFKATFSAGIHHNVTTRKGTPPRTTPMPPVIQCAVGRNQRIILNWLPLWPDATGYHVKRSSTAGGPYTVVASGIKGLSYGRMVLYCRRPF